MKPVTGMIIFMIIGMNSALCQTIHTVYPRYSSSELKHMICCARTPDEFNTLASYFEGKEQEYHQKAQIEQVELDRRLAMPYVSPKYPTPIDSARNLYRYYCVMAEDFSRRANAYRLRAQNANAVSGQPLAK